MDRSPSNVPDARRVTSLPRARRLTTRGWAGPRHIRAWRAGLPSLRKGLRAGRGAAQLRHRGCGFSEMAVATTDFVSHLFSPALNFIRANVLLLTFRSHRSSLEIFVSLLSIESLLV